MFNSIRLLDILSLTDKLKNTTLPIVRAMYSSPHKSHALTVGYRTSYLMRWVLVSVHRERVAIWKNEAIVSWSSSACCMIPPMLHARRHDQKAICTNGFLPDSRPGPRADTQVAGPHYRVGGPTQPTQRQLLQAAIQRWPRQCPACQATSGVR